MTYCVGLYLDDGLVMLSDTRTNAPPSPRCMSLNTRGTA